jgi:hypothetical protein
MKTKVADVFKLEFKHFALYIVIRLEVECYLIMYYMYNETNRYPKVVIYFSKMRSSKKQEVGRCINKTVPVKT